MGLDMYLYRREYISNYSFDQSSSDKFYAIANAVGIEPTAHAPHIHVDVCVAYWRKANAIHGWFVNTLADGVDECQNIYVTKENLIELRNLALAALNVPAIRENALPTKAGFFFGSYEYDEWYEADMKNTIEQIDKVLESCKNHEYVDFIYRASW